MRISTKGRYAVRLLLDLAEHRENGYISLKEIAERQEISKKYLEQIVTLLNKSDLLQTNRGFQGGYMLAVDPKACTVGDVLRLTEGSLAPIPCLDHSVDICPRRNNCSTLFVWQGLGDVIANYLDSITIQDILDKKQENFVNNYII